MGLLWRRLWRDSSIAGAHSQYQAPPRLRSRQGWQARRGALPGAVAQPPISKRDPVSAPAPPTGGRSRRHSRRGARRPLPRPIQSGASHRTATVRRSGQAARAARERGPHQYIGPRAEAKVRTRRRATRVGTRAGHRRTTAGRVLRLGGATAVGMLQPLGAALRRLYDSGWLVRDKLSLPSLCVGNAGFGGAGKTPVAQYLASRLLAQRRVPALVMRVRSPPPPGIRGNISIYLV